MLTPDQIWSILLSGVTEKDINEYILDYGITPESPTDPKVIADVTAAKEVATAAGNTGFENVLNKILTYGDKILTILTKTGVIANQNLQTAGYTIDTSKVVDTPATTSQVDTSTRLFNIDFTDPKVLIIVFLLFMILIYFLFFDAPKNGKKR